jgi:hypothetical protein
MVLLCFLCIDMALNFRWTSAGRSRRGPQQVLLDGAVLRELLKHSTAKSNAQPLYLMASRKTNFRGENASTMLPWGATEGPEMADHSHLTATIYGPSKQNRSVGLHTAFTGGEGPISYNFLFRIRNKS